MGHPVSGIIPSMMRVALLLVGSLAAGVANAQDVVPSDRDEEARALFEAGRVSYGAGRYDDALDYFERSYELSERPILLFNLASCEERLRLDADAIAHYEAYLEEIPDAENRGFVEERVAFLRASLAAAAAAAAPESEPEPDPSPPPEARSSDDGWIWALVIGGVVVAGVAIGVGVGVAASGTEAPYGGTGGFTIAALRF